MSKASKAKTSKVDAPKTKAAGIVDAAIQVGDDNAEIKRLASLSPLEYERERKAAAQKLGIERVAVLDDLIKGTRRDASGTKGQGKAIDLPPVEPWPQSVDGADLLTETTAAILRNMVMPDGAAEIVALWAAHTTVSSVLRLPPDSLSPVRKSSAVKPRCSTFSPALLPDRSRPQIRLRRQCFGLSRWRGRRCLSMRQTPS